VTGVAYVGGDPSKGAKVTVENRDKLVMPSVLEVRYDDGSTTRVALPVETWILRAETTVTLPAGRRIVSATVDPDHRLPDEDRANNTFTLPALATGK
jgi:hypothetical protein